MKHRTIRTVTVALLVSVFISVSPAYGGLLQPDAERAQHASAGAIAGDLLIIRPVTLGATFIGSN